MLRLYLDHNVPHFVARALRERQVDVLSALEDGRHGVPDDQLLDRAGELGRVLVSHDADLLREADRRQRLAVPFRGVIYSHQRRFAYGQLIDELELLATGSDEDELRDRVVYLPA